MNAFEDSLRRTLARVERRALPVRTSSSLSPDPMITIGIATIKIVTEEQIQAVAFGPIGEEPTVIVRLDPIGRDVSDLLPFATFLNETVDRAVREEEPLRIWLPHSTTLEALDVLGHRYSSNPHAPPEIQRMGTRCRAIAHEATIPGQQLVADATAQLQAHVVTGMAPIEEGHLNAILAWFDPCLDDPLTEARERIRLPASGILPNTPDKPYDDRVDRLRKEAKSASGPRRAQLEHQIDAMLREWVLHEWRLMVAGRRAFLSLGLPAAGLDGLIKDSTKRTTRTFTEGFFPARQPHKLAGELRLMEAGQEKADLAALENDPLLREQAARAGGVVVCGVSGVDQPKPNFSPCTITVDSAQGVIRLRRDDKIRIVGTNVAGVVRGFETAPNGGTRVTIEIKSGFKTRGVLTVGAQVEVIRDAFAFVNHRALKEVRENQSWIFYGDAAPTLPILPSTGQSALAVARAARR